MVTKNDTIKEEPVRDIKIKVIGVGGGGGSIITNISTNLSKALFCAVNTDIHALEEAGKNKKVKTVSFGSKITGGLGTGMDVKIGRRAAEEDIDDIKKLFEGQDIIVFVSSLGGGTGSGATPYFASIAKEMGSLVYGVFTLPFDLEGEKKMKMAKEAVRESISHLHAITIIPNEKIFEVVDKNTPLNSALAVINENLAQGLEGLIETIYETGVINIDFADVKTVLENKKGSRKLTYISTIEASLEDGAEQIVKKAVSNPLYPYKISKAKGILFNITGGKDIGLADFSSISESIASFTDDDAKIIIGSMQKNKLKSKVKIALLATGCETDFFKKELTEEEDVDPPKKEINKTTTTKKKVKKQLRKKPIQKKRNTVKEQKKEDPVDKKQEEPTKPKEEIVEVEEISIKSSTSSSVETPKEDDFLREEEGIDVIREEEKKWETPSFLRNKN